MPITSSSFPGLPRIRRLAFWLRLMCVLGAAAVLLIPLQLWTSDSWLLHVARHQWEAGQQPLNLSPLTRGLGLAIAALPGSAALLALWQLWSLFGCYARGQIFSAEPVQRLRRMGLALVALAPALPLSHTLSVLALTWQNPPGQRVLVLALAFQHYLALLFGLVLLAMATVMAEAARVAEENAGFV